MDFYNREPLPPTVRRMFDTLLNVSIASLGGVIAGMSIARRQNTSLQLTKLKLKKHTAAYIDHNLPSKWAVACGSFVGVIDLFVRWICPVSVSLDHLNDHADENVKESEGVTNIIGTIGDFTCGGAVAGAIFRGSAIQSASLKRFGPKVNLTHPRFQGFLSGLFPGMMLGLLAGIGSVSFTYLEKYVEEMVQEQELLELERQIAEENPSEDEEKEDSDE